jgi:hypothetical protein
MIAERGGAWINEIKLTSWMGLQTNASLFPFLSLLIARTLASKDLGCEKCSRREKQKPAKQMAPTNKKSSCAPSSQRIPTQFETKVYALCSSIPIGKVSTYNHIAKALHTSPRAIGAKCLHASGKNKIPRLLITRISTPAFPLPSYIHSFS